MDHSTASVGSRPGAVGVVTNGGCRDTDELIKQRVSVYSRYILKGIRPGRQEFESASKPVECGGVLVRPGHVIVADGDGVMIVPWEKARLVAEAAKEIQEEDKEARRKLYEALGIPLDFTVRPRKK